MVFSNTTDNNGIVEQARSFARVDSTQWPTYKISNSCNNYLDTVAGYLIATDRRFQWDDSNHTKLPIGTTDLTVNQSDYSFLTDEQSNKILTLTRLEVYDGSNWTQLKLIDQTDIDSALSAYQGTTGTPTEYDKIADNIVRLYPTPNATRTGGLKFYFQRTPSYFTASDTTKEPGVPALLHRGFVVAAAYDAAITLGLQNVQLLASEYAKEQQKMIEYFSGRNNDEVRRMVPAYENNR